MILALVNLAGGIYFFATPEGKFAIAAMIGAMMAMQIIFAKYGFVRLLGLGHILFWAPFLAWSTWRLQDWGNLPNDFRVWLAVVSTLNSVSLFIDIMDVWRFAKGEREEM